MGEIMTESNNFPPLSQRIRPFAPYVTAEHRDTGGPYQTLDDLDLTQVREVIVARVPDNTILGRLATGCQGTNTPLTLQINVENAGLSSGSHDPVYTLNGIEWQTAHSGGQEC
jgi:hypothetical protein